ncbi:mechanosensitive ion channel family protein [Fusibacter sp. JL298sf-3]
MDFMELKDKLFDSAYVLAKDLLVALIVLFIGFKIVKFIEKRVFGKVGFLKVDETLRRFLRTILSVTLRAVVVITAVGIAGVPMATFITLIGTAGVAIGLALQGSLSNLAAGVLIIALRPFKVGDFIDGGGHSGTITDIGLFYTRMTTVDNRAIILPNADLSSSSIVNYGYYDKRRLDMTFGVGYDSDISKVKTTILEVVNKHPMMLNDPEPFVRLSEHGDSALVFTLRVWVKTPDYWALHFDLQEQVKEAFDANGIEIPYPHLVVQNKAE